MIAAFFTNTIGGVEFDTNISEAHTAGMALTEYPVEAGAPIADHSYTEPRALVITFAHAARRFSAFSFFEPTTLRLTELYEALLELQRSGETFEVVTGLTVYQNMALKSLEAVRDKQHTTTVKIVATLREVVEIDLEQLEDFRTRFDEAAGIANRSSSVARRGRMTAVDVAPDSVEAASADTILLKGYKAARGLFQ